MAAGSTQSRGRGLRRCRGPLCFLVVLALLAGCGGDEPKPRAQTQTTESSKPVVTLGTKNFTEQYVLGELYKQALEAKGFRIELKQDIGSSEIVDRVLTSGGIDMYPEYTGVIVQEIAKEKRRPRTAEETYRRARAFESGRGFAVLRPSPGQDVLANGVRPEYARKHGLRSTSDLRKVGPFKYGGAPENRTRFQGAVGMERVYGLTDLEYVPIKIEDRYRALESGEADVIGVFSTEAQLAEGGDVVVLSDPKGIFGFQNIVPVVRKSVLRRQGPRFAKTLNAVNRTLTNRVLRELNAAVDLEGRAPAEVAREFLEEKGLV